MTKDEAEKLFKIVEDDLKLDYPEKQAHDIITGASLLVIGWIFDGAPVQDERFIQSVETAARILRISKGK